MKFLKTLPPWAAFLAILTILTLVLVTWLPGGLSLPWLVNEVWNTEPPVPVHESLDSLVEVSNRQGDATFKGYGIAVNYQGTRFIITSRMLFITPDDRMNAGETTVNGMSARLLAVNLTSDLVALQDCRPSPKPLYLKLIPKEQPESAVLATHNAVALTIALFTEAELRDGWIGLDYAPANSEGAPLFQDGDLVGLFLGFSKKGTAIAANNDALIQFGEQILEESK